MSSTTTEGASSDSDIPASVFKFAEAFVSPAVLFMVNFAEVFFRSLDIFAVSKSTVFCAVRVASEWTERSTPIKSFE